MAEAAMAGRVERIRNGSGNEAVWLVEHPPIYTAGTSTDMNDYRGQDDLPLYRTGRGGQLTYHGPGQRVVYVMLDLRSRGRDIRSFVGKLESWVVDSLAVLGIEGKVRPGRVGIWVGGQPDDSCNESKIAAIGLRLRGWVSFHGVSINIAPELENYLGIVPCGLPEYGVTSLREMGIEVTMADVDTILKDGFTTIFDCMLRHITVMASSGGNALIEPDVIMHHA